MRCLGHRCPSERPGQIGFTITASGQVRAQAKFRDHDGIVPPVTRYGPTKAAAERRLKGAIRDRKGTIGDGEITSESRFREVAERWLEEVSDTGLVRRQRRDLRAEVKGWHLPLQTRFDLDLTCRSKRDVLCIALPDAKVDDESGSIAFRR